MPLPVRLHVGALLAGLVLGLSVASGAWAQSSGIDRAIITAGTALNDAQKSALGAFVSKQAEEIRDSQDARAVEEARIALVTPARDPAATATFRRAYSIALAAELAPIAKGSDLRRALNAMQALRFGRTSESIDVLLDCANPAGESNAAKRIAAAGLVSDAFEDLDANNAYFESAARRLRDAMQGESDWIAIQQKLAGIASAARRKELPTDNARNIRKTQAEALAALAKSINAGSTADARMQSAQRSLVTLRNDLLVMPAADRAAVAKVLAPALADFIRAGVAHWDAARGDATLSASYGSVFNSCEVLLRIIDREERPQAYSGSRPDADARILLPAWESSDKAKFEAEAARWAGIVAAYKK